MLILPGADTWLAGQNIAFVSMAARFLDAGVPVAAICGATVGLARGGVLNDRNHTSNAVQILESDGYQVLEAMNGTEALHTVDEYGAPIHLLLTDMVMPGMNGKELANQLRLLHPDMSVLFMSGYDDRQIDSDHVVGGETAFLPKPFSTEILGQKVRAILDGLE